MPTLADGIARTLDGLGKAGAVADVVTNEAVEVAGFVGRLAKEREVDVDSLMTGDDETDRAYLQAADVEAALNSGIDWAALPAEVLKQAYSIVRATAAVVAIVG